MCDGNVNKSSIIVYFNSLGFCDPQGAKLRISYFGGDNSFRSPLEDNKFLVRLEKVDIVVDDGKVNDIKVKNSGSDSFDFELFGYFFKAVIVKEYGVSESLQICIIINWSRNKIIVGGSRIRLLELKSSSLKRP
jgi:hypothetical protein